MTRRVRVWATAVLSIAATALMAGLTIAARHASTTLQPGKSSPDSDARHKAGDVSHAYFPGWAPKEDAAGRRVDRSAPSSALEDALGGQAVGESA